MDRRIVSEHQLPAEQEQIFSAKVADLVHRAATFGAVAMPCQVDMGKVRERKRDMVDYMVAGTLKQYETAARS